MKIVVNPTPEQLKWLLLVILCVLGFSTSKFRGLV